MPRADIVNIVASGFMPDNRKLVILSPLNARGHINMLLEYADILKEDHNYRTVFLITGATQGTNIEERGHELLVLRKDGDTRGLFVETPEEKYTTFSEYNHALFKANLPSKNPEQILQEFLFAPYGIPDLSRRVWLAYHDNYERALSTLKPDLILMDPLHLPPCVTTLTMPWVVTHSINPFVLTHPKISTPPIPWIGCSMLTKEERLRLQREEPEKWQAMLDTWKGMQHITFKKNTLPPWTELCKKYNHNEAHPFRNVSPYLNIYVYPTECDYDQDDDLVYYADKWFRCDTLYKMDTPPTKADLLWQAKLEEAIRERPQVVYFSMGTMVSEYSDTINKYIEIFSKDTKRLYVVSTGTACGKVKLTGENIIGDSYLPQRLILKYASVAIIHGGNNSFLECIYFGVPMIVGPCFSDQFDNAARVEDLKIGKRIDIFHPVEDKLMEDIDELCNDTVMRKKLKQLSEKVRSRDSRKTVSKMLKKLVEDKKIDESFFRK